MVPRHVLSLRIFPDEVPVSGARFLVVRMIGRNARQLEYWYGYFIVDDIKWIEDRQSSLVKSLSISSSFP